MGVPLLFQWAFYRFPKAIRAAKKAGTTTSADAPPEADPQAGLPETFDCLYFDLNSMIHNCCHGADPLPEDATEDDMILRIFEQLDEIIDIIKPKKLVYIAIDGVVPCAKLLQQRTRRFRTAIEAAQDEQRTKRKVWDANLISPGTMFMEKVSNALKWYIYDRCNTEENLKKLTFILSDAQAGGEGEHKLVHYMKKLKATEGFDTKTTHCIYSQDADLILLGLLLHIPHVSLLREWQEVKAPMGARPRVRTSESSKWDFIHLSVVRDYLKTDFSNLTTHGIDFEGCVDDFVLLCLLMGNDFLPSLPSVHVKEGALEDVLEFYRSNFRGHLIEGHPSFVDEVRFSNKTKLSLMSPIIRYDRLWYILNYWAQKEARLFKTRRNNMRFPPKEAFDFTVGNYVAEYSAKIGGNEKVAKDYLQGLQWVVSYFFTGNASWMWTFESPFPPLVSCMAAAARGFTAEAVAFNGRPLTPLQSLLAILPKESAEALPEVFRELGKEGGSLSGLYAGEPRNEKIAGRTVTIAAPVDLLRLKAASGNSEVLAKLSPQQQQLNTFGPSLAFCNVVSVPAAARFLPPPESDSAKAKKARVDTDKEERVKPLISAALTGNLRPWDGATPEDGAFPLAWDLLDPVEDNKVASFIVDLPPHIPHSRPLLPGTEDPPCILTATEKVMGSNTVYPVLI